MKRKKPLRPSRVFGLPNFKTMSGYNDFAPDTKGLLKTGLGLGFGRVNGGLQSVMGASGFYATILNMAEGVLKV